jgi:hypothetical protein
MITTEKGTLIFVIIFWLSLCAVGVIMNWLHGKWVEKLKRERL